MGENLIDNQSFIEKQIKLREKEIKGFTSIKFAEAIDALMNSDDFKLVLEKFIDLGVRNENLKLWILSSEVMFKTFKILREKMRCEEIEMNENRLKADWLLDVNNTLADSFIEIMCSEKMKSILEKYLEKGVSQESLLEWCNDPSIWTSVLLKVYEKVKGMEDMIVIK